MPSSLYVMIELAAAKLSNTTRTVPHCMASVATIGIHRSWLAIIEFCCFFVIEKRVTETLKTDARKVGGYAFQILLVGWSAFPQND